MNQFLEKKDTISIIVPVYNVEKYIDSCIESILNQTYENIEIILVDDGSTDASLLKCREWEKRDSRIKIVHQDNNGLSSARNIGVQLAQGDYITFIDSDDTVERDYVESLYNSLIECDADISLAYLDTSNNQNTNILSVDEKNPSGETAIELLLTGKIPIYSTVKLYRKDIAKSTPFVEGMVFEDNIYAFQILEKCNKVAICSRILYHQLIREDSISHERSINRFHDLFKSHMMRAEFLASYYSPLDKRCIVQKLDSWCYIECQYEKYYKHDLKSRSECLDIIKEHRNLRKELLDKFYILKQCDKSLYKKMVIEFFIMKFAPSYCYSILEIIRKMRKLKGQIWLHNRYWRNKANEGNCGNR